MKEIILIIVAVVLCAGLIAGCTIWCVTGDNVKNITISFPLVSEHGVKTLSSLHGDFFLGCGHIEGEENEYYVMFIKTAQRILRVKLPVENTYINETYGDP